MMLLFAYFQILRATFAAGDCPENYFWDGKKCSVCSGCTLGFGLKEPCTKTKNTECQPCIPGYDYSDSTGMEECIKCDTYSNCLPGRSKKITKCTIFSGHTCDGCEEGYYHHQDVGCDKCSPKCDAMTEDEIQACTTKHNRVCAPKRVLPKTPPIFSNDSKGGHPNNTTNDKDDEIPPDGPKLEESKTNQPREENSISENLWPWVLLMVIVTVLVVIGFIGIYKIRSRRNRPAQPEGDVNTHNTEENIALREQTIPLITEGGVDAHDTRETFSSGPRHELEQLDSGGVDALEPSSEDLNRQKALGLDRPIKDLRIKEKKQIKNDLSGKDIEGYFYWQSIAEELDLKDESRGWEGVQNPIENLLKAFGEKEGSTIRGLVEATRRAGLTHCASQLENQFDTAPRNEADSAINVPEYTGEETDANDIADTAV
ncbi:tumor necrosis factor receptor superfamily member 16-like isoform X6 [Pocillopora verrucosa]|uniref:tumor necrosis factor receptor superfamily member 16-like isoform X6 n=1 Tax=Pocillopora verrucosa TaxID=203993 RepID=UPI0033424D8F